MHAVSRLSASIALALAATIAVPAWASGTNDGRPADVTPAAATTPVATSPTAIDIAGPDGDQDPGGPEDQVIPDDLIVQGSICAGFDCIENENFGFSTLILKENNLRIFFDDTSATAGFSANDWTLVANDSGSGGVSRFSIEDTSAARAPFTILAGAPANSLFVGSGGDIGIRTDAPFLDLHANASDTPGLRLEQNDSGGFTAQTWDVAGNEANFFVRDLTNGSQLPFRIRPGAPTSSLDIAASGNVGIGTAGAQTRLHVAAASEDAPDDGTPLFLVSNPNYPEAARNRFEVDSDGNVAARGTISQLSSRSAKWDFAPIDGEQLLARVRALPVTTWKYLSSEVRHAGPVAEDFHSAFGLGDSDRMIAPADLAGVALAAVKALQQEVDERDRRIEALEQRLLEIESRLSH